jgi:hypothetical protein
MWRAVRRIGCFIVLVVGALAIVALKLSAFITVLEKLRTCKPSSSRFTAPAQPACHPIPAHIYRRADPLIYSQQYLMSQGLAVTWENPDVSIQLGGLVVDPYDLQPSTVYDVVARVWNGSVDAPAINLLVQFSYLSFGIGTKKTPIGAAHVDLGAKGAPDCPAFAHRAWKTPATPGHYCLLIELIWDDDANPRNNVGQSNTVVKPLNSPHAAFSFDVANNDDVRHAYRFTLDAYAIPTRPSCNDTPPGHFPTPTPSELKLRARKVRAEHDRAAFPVPPNWSVVVQPPEVVLAPGATTQVAVDVTAPDGFTGRQAFNVTAFDEHASLVGGVTLAVEG